MDVKLDFLPPALINFVSRQVVGSGFKLYKKVSDTSLDISFENNRSLCLHYFKLFMNIDLVRA